MLPTAAQLHACCSFMPCSGNSSCVHYLLGQLLGSLVSRGALWALGIKDRDIDLLRGILEGSDGEGIIVQAIVDQHHALTVVLVLAVDVTPLGLDVIGCNLTAVVSASRDTCQPCASCRHMFGPTPCSVLVPAVARCMSPATTARRADG